MAPWDWGGHKSVSITVFIRPKIIVRVANVSRLIDEIDPGGSPSLYTGRKLVSMLCQCCSNVEAWSPEWKGVKLHVDVGQIVDVADSDSSDKFPREKTARVTLANFENFGVELTLSSNFCDGLYGKELCPYPSSHAKYNFVYRLFFSNNRGVNVAQLSSSL